MGAPGMFKPGKTPQKKPHARLKYTKVHENLQIFKQIGHYFQIAFLENLTKMIKSIAQPVFQTSLLVYILFSKVFHKEKIHIMEKELVT